MPILKGHPVQAPVKQNAKPKMEYCALSWFKCPYSRQTYACIGKIGRWLILFLRQSWAIVASVNDLIVLPEHGILAEATLFFQGGGNGLIQYRLNNLAFL